MKQSKCIRRLFKKMIKEMQFNPLTSKYACFFFTILGGTGGLFIWLFLPHNSELNSIWDMLFKIAVFIFICLGIAYFPNQFKYRYLLVCLPFFGFLGYILPRISYYGFFGGDILANDALTGELYTFLYLLLYPGIVLTVCFAYRMGGGGPGSTLKIALNGVVLIFSGFLDVLWPLVNPVEIPDIIYAQHIKVILGHFASYREAVVFTLFHIPILVGINLLPIERWLDSLIPDRKPRVQLTQ